MGPGERRIRWNSQQALMQSSVCRVQTLKQHLTQSFRSFPVDWDNLPRSETTSGQVVEDEMWPQFSCNTSKILRQSLNTSGHIWAVKRELGIPKAAWCSLCLFTARSGCTVAIPSYPRKYLVEFHPRVPEPSLCTTNSPAVPRKSQFPAAGRAHPAHPCTTSQQVQL